MRGKKSASVQAYIDEANKRNITISQVALEKAAKQLEKSEEAVFKQMADSYAVMKEAAKAGLSPDLKSNSGLVGGMAAKVRARADAGNSLAGTFLSDVVASALAVSESNACMGKIVAAPTAGSSGIIPACLIALQKHCGVSDDQAVMGLFNASAIGMVIAENASIAGAQGGCQAECGAAAAMAASAMVELLGGPPEACGHAAAQALKSLMGLVCDPVAGLVEEPCVVRNAASAAIAVTAAELALSGVFSIIPVDEVIFAMDAVGKSLPEDLRETANGGLAKTETGQKIAARLK